MTSRPATEHVILVHGAWHGAWAWERLIGPLRDRGLWPTAIDLPGHGESQVEPSDLYGDADALKSVLDELDGQVLLVGHSYGGMVITDAGGHPAVRGLVYVAGFLPLEGETLNTAGTGDGSDQDPPSALTPCTTKVGDGSMLVLQGSGVSDALYGGCDPSTQRWAAERLGLQPTASFKQTARHLAWKGRPTTYVVCTLDKTIPPSRQRRMAKHADRVVELESDHSPQLSVPGRLADVIADAARSL